MTLDGNFSYELYDSRGRIVAIGDGNAEVSIDVSLYEMGVYNLRIISDSIQYVERIIKH